MTDAAIFPGFSRDTFDDALINPEVVANAPEMLERFADLRRDDPVHWTEPKGFRPFWSLSRHADILAVSKDNARFINRERTYLTPIPAEQDILAKTGDTHLFRTLVDLDDPEHMKLRKLTHDWFLPANLKKLEPRIREIARAHVDRMAALGGGCDFVNEVALWYPLRVIMMLLGIPETDEPMMLKMTQEIFGAGDPDVVARSNRLTSGGGAEPGREQVDLVALAQAFFAYFAAVTADRRVNPKDDVATVIANGLIDGQPIGDLQAMSYYVIIATAGHDTTSSTAAGGLFHLIRNPGELAKLKADPSLIPLFVEEAIRWATPVKHFMRTATEDVEIGGKTIRKGEHLALFYWSGNFDDRVFDDPYAFKADRKPNPHIAFGNGVHICLGLHLARLELRILFEELLPRLDSIELAGDPANSRSNFVSGLKTLPVRYRMT